MKNIKKDELFQSLSGFLKSKGVEFTEGAYSQRIHRACDLLTDTINTTQKGVQHAKVKVDKKLDQLRQSIHEATAPKPPPASSAPKPAANTTDTKKSTPKRKQASASVKPRKK